MGTVADWVVALGTLAVALVALFGDMVRGLFAKPPRLKILDEKGVTAKVKLSFTDGEGQLQERFEDARYYHIEVANPRRRLAPLRGVRVYLVMVEQRSADQTFRPIWNARIPVMWRTQAVQPLLQDIGPAAHADLCSVVKGKFLQLHLLTTPFDLETVYREPVALRLTFLAHGLLVDSAPFPVEVHWDGEWDDDAEKMSRHLVVKPSQIE